MTLREAIRAKHEAAASLRLAIKLLRPDAYLSSDTALLHAACEIDRQYGTEAEEVRAALHAYRAADKAARALVLPPPLATARST